MNIKMLFNDSPTFAVPSLRFKKDDLEPYVSSDTVYFHYYKHTSSYFEKTNKALANMSSEILKKENITDLQALVKFLSSTDDEAFFNQAAQAWNHAFYWESLISKNKAGKPSPALLKQIEKDFQDLNNFKLQFKEKCLNHFASGWGWLVYRNDTLFIETTSNAETPITNYKKVPLLTCDLWEHAYYLDTQNNKEMYIKNFWNIINWDIINERFNNARR